MADRSDDIKQLFAHLGLNPGDYQEVQTMRRPELDTLRVSQAASVPTSRPPSPAIPSSAVAPETALPAGAPATTMALPQSAPIVEVSAPAAAPVAVAPATPLTQASAPALPAGLPPLRREVPSVPVAPGIARGLSSAAEETTRRWALLRAVQDRPQAVARIQPELRRSSGGEFSLAADLPPTRPVADADAPLRSRSAWPAPAQSPAPVPAVVAAPLPPAAPTLSSDAVPLPSAAATAPMPGLAASAQRPVWRPEPGITASTDRLTQSLRRVATPKPTSPAGTREPRIAPPVGAYPAGGREDAGLSGTFDRLLCPPVAALVQGGGRLKLKLPGAADSPSGPRLESLSDVFARLGEQPAREGARRR